MDNHQSAESLDSLAEDAGQTLDSVTAELKAEFARLKRERINERKSQARNDQRHAVVICAGTGGIRRYELLRTADTARGRVTDLTHALSILDPLLSDVLRNQIQFWNNILDSALDALAKLSTALFTRSFQASLRTPLFLDGPELSGYKHRLR
ncbi:hypothetical protein O203_23945 [Ectopseudomonas chengduensis]|nr:hypothetical protein O203_23945 [Pseudomonas chengduensis]